KLLRAPGEVGDRDPGSRPEHPAELPRGRGLVGERAQRALAQHAVARLVRYGQRFGVALNEPDPRRQAGLRGGPTTGFTPPWSPPRATSRSGRRSARLRTATSAGSAGSG